MSFKALYEVFTSVQTTKKSGKLYIKAAESSAKNIAYLTFNQGEIIDISYLSLSGISALHKILSLSIDKIVFIPSSPNPTAQQQANKISINKVLDIMSQRENLNNNSQLSSIKAAENLGPARVNLIDPYKAAEQVLKGIYGPSISQGLNKIAHDYPPKINPQRFLKECEKKAQLLVGAEKAYDLFAELYKQFK